MSQKALMHATRAQILKRTLGTRCAAGYLRNRGIELDEALVILVGRAPG